MTGEAPARRRARPGELDDVTLRRAQAGDEPAFRALVERYQRPIWDLCWRMLAPVGSLPPNSLSRMVVPMITTLAPPL